MSFRFQWFQISHDLSCLFHLIIRYIFAHFFLCTCCKWILKTACRVDLCSGSYMWTDNLLTVECMCEKVYFQAPHMHCSFRKSLVKFYFYTSKHILHLWEKHDNLIFNFCCQQSRQMKRQFEWINENRSMFNISAVHSFDQIEIILIRKWLFSHQDM